MTGAYPGEMTLPYVWVRSVMNDLQLARLPVAKTGMCIPWPGEQMLKRS